MRAVRSGFRVGEIGVLGATVIADDPRIRRQIEALTSAGWEVTAFGLNGGASAPTAARLDGVPADPPRGAFGRLRLGATLAPAILSRGLAERAYWRMQASVARIYTHAIHTYPHLWFANDWITLPIAARLATEQNVPFVYDTHALATQEFPDSWLWTLFWRPLVARIEAQFVGQAALVSCVSPGIAERLANLYRLPAPPLVIRNAPAFEPGPFRPTGPRIDVLYHGQVKPGRGLEIAIRSVASWRAEFTLTIRGPASSARYAAALHRLAAANGVADRVSFAPAVAMTDLVREARRSDIGLSLLPGSSLNNRLALPHRLFEYVMAGLAVCVSDLPEMRALVERHRLGGVVAAFTPQSLADAINALDRPTIDRLKGNALIAARELNWENESRQLLARFGQLLPQDH